MLCKKILNNKFVLISWLLVFLLLFYWGWLFYITQPATLSNTYIKYEKVIGIETRLAHHRGIDKLFVISEENSYLLNTGWRDENKTTALAEDILDNANDCTLIIWEHIPKNFFEIQGNDVKVYQVIDLRNSSNVFIDIENHNNFQKTERIAGIIAGVFLTTIVATFNFFVFCSTRKSRPRKTIRGKNNQGTVSVKTPREES